ncbi:GDP-L-fucose synthase [Flavobacteriaceae bacterium]|nr:GDP-L-fucose synthase [Flavobacteriaceae bacterium]
MDKNSKIFIAGHLGMVGSACMRLLKQKGYTNVIVKTRFELDLTKQEQVETFFKKENPDVVIDAAAKVGGILANDTYPYEFLMDNMLIQNNLIKSSLDNNVNKFIFLGSSCIYPKLAPQPLKEEYLLTAPLEPTNQWYAVAKISGVKLIESIRIQFGKDYVSLMPTNLYGPNDNYDLKNSHVLPAMIRKFHEAKKEKRSEVLLWGSGSPYREFLHVDDLAKAVLFALQNKLPDSLYNVGSSNEISIKELAILVKEIVGFQGAIKWDNTKPDGTPRKLMDSSKLNNLNWRSTIALEDGIKSVYDYFKKDFNGS